MNGGVKIGAFIPLLAVGVFYLIQIPRIAGFALEAVLGSSSFFVPPILGLALLIWFVLSLVFKRSIQTLVSSVLLSACGLFTLLLMMFVSGFTT